MTYQPRTPFRRAYEAARLKDIAPIETPRDVPSVNKWTVLRELGVARKAFGLSDRTLTVLQTLLSFHSETELSVNAGPPIVYPANATICERLNGMPCSTMRRHLATLVSTGLLIRRDSPNGKRFKRNFGAQSQTFGFDLSPLVTRFAEITEKADQIRNDEAHLKQLRLNASLMRRDLAALSELARMEHPDLSIWDAYDDIALLTARTLRRSLTSNELELVTQKITNALSDLQHQIDQLTSVQVSSKNAQNEQQHQSSNIEIERKPVSSIDQTNDDVLENEATSNAHVSLGLVTSVCLEIKSYFSEPVLNWHDFAREADRIRPMMGVSSSVWGKAINAMGIEQASIVLAAMLERFSEIRSINGYLSYLSNKAEAGKFSCNPMLLAIARQRKLECSQL
mgnify:CR=1 FL=1